MSVTDKLFADLRVIASLTPGQTLSTTTMTPLEHNSWYTAFYRKINGEGAVETIQHIKSIISQALELYSDITRSPTMSVSTSDNESKVEPTELASLIKSALSGFSNLEKTYVGLYYPTGDIVTSISELNYQLDSLESQYANHMEVLLEPTLEQCVEAVVIDNLNGHKLDGSILDDVIEEKKNVDLESHTSINPCGQNSPCITPLVSLSDRTEDIKTSETTFDINSEEFSPKSRPILSDVLHMTNLDNFNESLSNETIPFAKANESNQVTPSSDMVMMEDKNAASDIVPEFYFETSDDTSDHYDESFDEDVLFSSSEDNIVASIMSILEENVDSESSDDIISDVDIDAELSQENSIYISDTDIPDLEIITDEICIDEICVDDEIYVDEESVSMVLDGGEELDTLSEEHTESCDKPENLLGEDTKSSDDSETLLGEDTKSSDDSETLLGEDTKSSDDSETLSGEDTETSTDSVIDYGDYFTESTETVVEESSESLTNKIEHKGNLDIGCSNDTCDKSPEYSTDSDTYDSETFIEYSTEADETVSDILYSEDKSAYYTSSEDADVESINNDNVYEFLIHPEMKVTENKIYYGIPADSSEDYLDDYYNYYGYDSRDSEIRQRRRWNTNIFYDDGNFYDGYTCFAEVSSSSDNLGPNEVKNLEELTNKQDIKDKNETNTDEDYTTSTESSDDSFTESTESCDEDNMDINGMSYDVCKDNMDINGMSYDVCEDIEVDYEGCRLINSKNINSNMAPFQNDDDYSDEYDAIDKLYKAETSSEDSDSETERNVKEIINCCNEVKESVVRNSNETTNNVVKTSASTKTMVEEEIKKRSIDGQSNIKFNCHQSSTQEEIRRIQTLAGVISEYVPDVFSNNKLSIVTATQKHNEALLLLVIAGIFNDYLKLSKRR